MNIADMPAGPEIDALVATDVMGWKWAEKGTSGCPHAGWFVGEVPHWTRFRLYEWSPSTNIAHAFEVVDEITKRCGCPFHVDIHDNTMCSIFIASLKKHITSRADTSPLAICRAALMAAGSNDKPPA